MSYRPRMTPERLAMSDEELLEDLKVARQAHIDHWAKRGVDKRKIPSAEELFVELRGKKGHVALKMGSDKSVKTVEEPEETDEEVGQRIREHFDVLEHMANGAIKGDIRSFIVSGAAGLGKTYTVEAALTAWDPNEINHTFVRGYVKATGLYKLLYTYREKGKVIVFDDSDSIMFDDVALNLLKAVTDTTDRRRVSWRSEAPLYDEDGGDGLIPKSFEFEGTIIFISNLDFEKESERNRRLGPHLQAMLSRSHYIDLRMRTRRESLIRIKQVIEDGLLRKQGLDEHAENEVVEFLTTNFNRLRETSLRMVLKIASLRKTSPARWQNLARVTCCKN